MLLERAIHAWRVTQRRVVRHTRLVCGQTGPALNQRHALRQSAIIHKRSGATCPSAHAI
jgi:hypothetical protein